MKALHILSLKELLHPPMHIEGPIWFAWSGARHPDALLWFALSCQCRRTYAVSELSFWFWCARRGAAWRGARTFFTTHHSSPLNLPHASDSGTKINSDQGLLTYITAAYREFSEMRRARARSLTRCGYTRFFFARKYPLHALHPWNLLRPSDGRRRDSDTRLLRSESLFFSDRERENRNGPQLGIIRRPTLDSLSFYFRKYAMLLTHRAPVYFSLSEQIAKHIHSSHLAMSLMIRILKTARVADLCAKFLHAHLLVRDNNFEPQRHTLCAYFNEAFLSDKIMAREWKTWQPRDRCGPYEDL